MAIVFDGPVTPDALTTFIRTVPTPANYVLNQILPDRTIGSNKVDISEVTRTNRAAKFRAFDGRIHRSERDSLTTSTVNLPPLSSMNGMGELERLQLEAARQRGGSQSAIIDAIYNDAELLTGEVRTRMELARGDVLTDGKFTLAGENGLYLEADFGMPGNHQVTAGTVWSNTAAATPISDLIAWVDVYTATNGAPPGGIVLSRKALGYLLRNAELRTLSASLAGTPGLVPRPVLDQALDIYGIPPILFVYDTQADVDTVATRILAENKLLMVPATPGALGYTAWGVSATALELVNSADADFSFDDAPGIVGVVEKSGPPYREETFVDAVGMPILTNPKLLFAANVY